MILNNFTNILQRKKNSLKIPDAFETDNSFIQIPFTKTPLLSVPLMILAVRHLHQANFEETKVRSHFFC